MRDLCLGIGRAQEDGERRARIVAHAWCNEMNGGVSSEWRVHSAHVTKKCRGLQINAFIAAPAAACIPIFASHLMHAAHTGAMSTPADMLRLRHIGACTLKFFDLLGMPHELPLAVDRIPDDFLTRGVRIGDMLVMPIRAAAYVNPLVLDSPAVLPCQTFVPHAMPLLTRWWRSHARVVCAVAEL